MPSTGSHGGGGSCYHGEERETASNQISNKWIVPFVHGAISQTPNLSSKEIILLLQPYIIDIFLTTALIQKVRTHIRNQVFGDPDTNVTYVSELTDLLVSAGHDFEILWKTPLEVKKRLLAVVLKQKINSLKKKNKVMAKAEKLAYLDKWQDANIDMFDLAGLGKNCGKEGVGPEIFLSGIFCPFLQQGQQCPYCKQFIRLMQHI